MLRGIAILMVILVHLADRMLPDGCLKHVCSFGQMGCQVFFALSGYCLCCSMRNNTISTGRFYVKRLSSLAPAYWLAIVIGLLLSLLCPGIFRVYGKPAAVLQNLFLLNGLTLNWNVMNNVVFGGWFVGTLVLMYALFPMLYRAFFMDNPGWKRCRIVIFPLITIVLCWILMVVSGIGGDSFCENDSVKYFSIVNQLPSFVIGFSIYDAVQSGLKGCLPLSILLFAVSLFFFFVPTRMSFVICPTTMALSIAFLFVQMNRKDIKYPGFLCKAGDKSYSVYLSHIWAVSLGAFLMENGMPSVIGLPLILGGIVLIAFMFDRLTAMVKIH